MGNLNEEYDKLNKKRKKNLDDALNEMDNEVNKLIEDLEDSSN